jgi:iron complex outermembrane receptor protein
MARISFCSLVALVGSCAPALIPSARAGDESGASPVLEEVVVTAERRAEKMQEVPISMSAITGVTLENLGSYSITNYAKLIPNLTFETAAGMGGAGSGGGVATARGIAIRGVAGDNTTALYLNDTPVPMSLDPRAIDIDRIEVLRGPQGTLFGAGAMGGTVRIVTREPSVDSNSAKVEADGSYVEHGGGGYSTDGVGNFVLVPGNVALRVSAFSAFDPGVYTRTWGGPLDPRSPIISYPPGGAPVGQKDHVGGEQQTGVAATVAITPTTIPGLSITPMFMYQHYNTNGYPLADYTATDFVQTRPLDVPEETEDRWSFASVTVRQDESFGQFIAFGTYFYRDSLDLEDVTEVNAITFWGLPYYVAAPLPNVMINETWTGEGRFESKIPGPVQFIVGVYDSLSERRFNEIFYTPGLNAALGGAIGTDLQYWQATPNADRQRATYLDVTYQVTSAFQLSAGIRRSYLDHQGGVIAGGPLNGGYQDIYSEHGERDTAPRFTAKYQFSPDHMLYASAAKGFRIGGTNTPLPPVCAADLARLGVTNGQPFQTDSLWDYEFGLKDAWLDNRIKSRLAIYRIDWKGIQQEVYLPCTYEIVANSGAAVSKGAELEVDVAATNHLLLNFAAGYEDAQITEATAQSDTVVGQPLTDVPKWTGSLIGQYSVPMGSRTAFVRGDATYTGFRTSFYNVRPPTGLPLDAYTLVNLRTGIDQGPWELALFAQNLFDKLGAIGDQIPDGGVLPGRPRLFVTRPRTVGLHVQRRF